MAKAGYEGYCRNMPPRPRTWDNESHQNMLKNTLDRLQSETTNIEKVLMMGDFICKEVVWEDFEVLDSAG